MRRPRTGSEARSSRTSWTSASSSANETSTPGGIGRGGGALAFGASGCAASVVAGRLVLALGGAWLEQPTASARIEKQVLVRFTWAPCRSRPGAGGGLEQPDRHGRRWLPPPPARWR